ncbi:TPA: LPXTG cell wall anchor domain-containing protein, partial [Streptococcus suis]
PTPPVVPTSPVVPTVPVVQTPPIVPTPLITPSVPVQSGPLKVEVAPGTKVAVLPNTGETDSTFILIMSGGAIVASLSLAGTLIRRND